MAITLYGTALRDDLSSYLLFGTHSNRAYRERKLMRGMGMGGNRDANRLLAQCVFEGEVKITQRRRVNRDMRRMAHSLAMAWNDRSLLR